MDELVKDYFQNQKRHFKAESTHKEHYEKIVSQFYFDKIQAMLKNPMDGVRTEAFSWDRLEALIRERHEALAMWDEEA